MTVDADVVICFVSFIIIIIIIIYFAHKIQKNLYLIVSLSLTVC